MGALGFVGVMRLFLRRAQLPLTADTVTLQHLHVSRLPGATTSRQPWAAPTEPLGRPLGGRRETPSCLPGAPQRAGLFR